MRTNIVLDDELIEKARGLTGLKTKRAVVEEGLRTLIRLREQDQVRALFGKLRWDGDLAAQREDATAVVVVDSTVWIDHFNGTLTPEVSLLHQCLGSREIGIGDLILCEVLQGFREDRDFRTARRALLSFPVFGMAGKALAEKAATNCRTLRKRGVTNRKTIDVLIATFVIERGLHLLHRDTDFDPFERELGLQVLRASGSTRR